MDTLHDVGLSVKATENVRNLSGGQRQRVAIARAIINSPRVLLADEPTGALDSKTGENIMNLLMNRVETGSSLILVTHDESIARYCNRRLQMHDGRIFE